ncbi:glycogen synthase [Bacteroidia bacterium]|nr:glycogen synthase [Bacteroidia bacterium]
MNLIINDVDHPLVIKVASIQSARMQIYFIDNEDYFQRKYIATDEDGHFFEDNDERTIFFTRGVFETVKKLRWPPDLIFCQGWFASLIPLFLRKVYSEDPMFSKAKIIYSTSDDEFKGSFDKNYSRKLISENITQEDVEKLTDPTYINITKLAFDHSDGVILNTPNIPSELRQYADTSGKPHIEYTNKKEYVSQYAAFFDKIIGV